MEFPKDNLTRAVTFRAEPSDDGLTLEGYAAVFGERTRISGWEGDFDEEISRGAFSKTLSERTPVLQFDHGHHPLVGSIPIGVPEELREDDHGLYVRARLHDNWLVEPVRDAIRDGSITGMSFRFSVDKEAIDDTGDRPLRTVKEVKLFELGPVVFPAYEATSVGVRSQFTQLLADPDSRAELARALLLGTPADAAGSTTADDGAATSQEPPEHSGMNPNERARVLALITQENPS